MSEHQNRPLPLDQYVALSPSEMAQRADQFLIQMQRRCSVRAFSDRPVDRGIIEKCLLAAGSAPKGVNQ